MSLHIPQPQFRWIHNSDYDRTSENPADRMPLQLQQLHLGPERRWFPVPVVDIASTWRLDQIGYPDV